MPRPETTAVVPGLADRSINPWDPGGIFVTWVHDKALLVKVVVDGVVPNALKLIAYRILALDEEDQIRCFRIVCR